MDQLLGDIVTQEAMPESLVPRCLDTLRKMYSSERDLIRVVVEVISELRDIVREPGDIPVRLVD